MKKNTNSLNISFFGSSPFSVNILENIHSNCGKSIGEVAKKQFSTFKGNHKKFSQIKPVFWKDVETNSDIWKIPVLKKIINLDTVVSQKDSQNGKKIITNPVIDYCKRKKLKYYCPEKISTEIDTFIKYLKNTDLSITASFGQLIPQTALELGEFGYLNWHPSLLPQYRGATPVQSAILNGESISGLSWIEMTKEMDAGDIYFQDEVKILKDETFTEIIKKMAILGSQTWAMVIAARILDLQNYQSEIPITWTPARQDHNQATFTKKINKDLKNIKTEKLSAKNVFDHYRAYLDFPGTWIKVKYFDDNCKIHKANGFFDEEKFKKMRAKSSTFSHEKDLYVLKIDKQQRVFLKCKQGYLEIVKICTSKGKSINLSGFNF
jgi:methionyl-tRNA formyltransferase